MHLNCYLDCYLNVESEYLTGRYCCFKMTEAQIRQEGTGPCTVS